MFFYSFGYSQEYPYIGWNDILLHRTLSDLGQLEKENTNSLLKNYLLVTEDGGVIKNTHSNQHLYNLISFKSLAKRGFFNDIFLKKLLKKSQKAHIYFLKTHIYSINNNIYIAFDECFVTKDSISKKNIVLKKIKTYAVYKYRFNKNTKDYELENKDLIKN